MDIITIKLSEEEQKSFNNVLNYMVYIYTLY